MHIIKTLVSTTEGNKFHLIFDLITVRGALYDYLTVRIYFLKIKFHKE